MFSFIQLCQKLGLPTNLSIIPCGCLVCGQVTHSASNICEACLDDLPRPNRVCRRCGQQLVIKNSAMHCGRCIVDPPPFDSLSAAFRYESPIKNLLAGFKFKARFAAGKSLAMEMATAMECHYANRPRPELLIPVPLHLRRLRERGFNQAIEISRVVKKRLQIPMDFQLLLRVKDTAAQSELKSSRARQTNLRGAFRLNPSAKTNSEAVRHIALIDDVVTTMATVEAASKELRGLQGLERVDVWCIARVSR